MLENIIYDEVSSPPYAEHLLRRPNVENLLKNAFKKPLTTVIAGAGYGKTQAVFSALKSIEYRSVWLQLSELDNMLSRFWERIIFAVKLHSNDLAERLLSLGFPESMSAFNQFLHLIARHLIDEKRLIVVLDDFHFITEKAILNFLELLIHAHIKNFSIVLISRTKPDLSLASMLSNEFLARITENDLCFTKDEMKAYFNQQAINLSESMSDAVYSYTNGWIFAIYLVGLTVKKGDIDSQNPILEAKIDIFDLIEKEIFSAASNKLQSFLIKISILDVIPSGLLKELADNDFELISEMQQLSMFIGYNSFSDRYRIHQLFREFLMERKGRLTECEIVSMHMTAAKWYEKNNCKFEAISHYKECGHYEEILDIILSFPHQVPKETADSIIRLIEQAPNGIVAARPVIRVVKARYMFNNNRIEEAKRELSDIRKEFEELPRTKENDAVLGETYIILALISIVNLDFEFEKLFKMADEYLPEGSTLIDAKVTIADGINVCSVKNPSSGELKRHQDALFSAAPYASRVMNGCGYGMEYLNAAESGLYTGDFKAAEKYAYKAIYKSREYQQYDIEYMANFVLVRIFTAKGKYSEISDILDQMQTQLKNLHIPECIALNDVIRGWFYTKIKKIDKVPKWIRYEEETRKMLPPVTLGREYLVRSDCLLAEDRHLDLLGFMTQTDQMYEARGILYARIQNKITKAIIYHYMGSYEKSINMLNEAYELTHPNNLIMQYIEYGSQMRTLIHSAKRNKDCKIPIEWLDKIHTKASTYAKQLGQVVSAYNKDHELEDSSQIKLSKRESEVLTYLYRGLTREEIAESCYLAVSTINDVVKNIYAKLGAGNVVDAVRIAKERNIL